MTGERGGLEDDISRAVNNISRFLSDQEQAPSNDQPPAGYGGQGSGYPTQASYPPQPGGNYGQGSQGGYNNGPEGGYPGQGDPNYGQGYEQDYGMGGGGNYPPAEGGPNGGAEEDPGKKPHRVRRIAAGLVVLGIVVGAGAYYENGGKEKIDSLTSADQAKTKVLPPRKVPVPTSTASSTAKPKPTKTKKPSPTKTKQPAVVAPQPLACVKEIPLRDKLGQKLAFSLYSETMPQQADFFAKNSVGYGVVMDAEPAQTIKDFKGEQKLPLWLATDQEGGTVQRFIFQNDGQPVPAGDMTNKQANQMRVANNLKLPKGVSASKYTKDMLDQQLQERNGLPAADQLAKMKDAKIKQLFTNNYTLLHKMGIDLVFGPVVGLKPKGEASPLGSRVISEDPNTVSRVAQLELDAIRAAGLKGTLKHYPGNPSADTNFKAAQSKPFDWLKQRDLSPYKQLAGNKDLSVMVGSQTTQGGFSKDQSKSWQKLPASWNHEAVQYLRKNLGYQNSVLFSDSQNSVAISMLDGGKSTTAVPNVWESGVDVALISTPDEGLNYPQEFDAIVANTQKAIKDGNLSEKEIDQSVLRIFEQKGIDACNNPIYKYDKDKAKKHAASDSQSKASSTSDSTDPNSKKHSADNSLFQPDNKGNDGSAVKPLPKICKADSQNEELNKCTKPDSVKGGPVKAGDRKPAYTYSNTK